MARNRPRNLAKLYADGNEHLQSARVNPYCDRVRLSNRRIALDQGSSFERQGKPNAQEAFLGGRGDGQRLMDSVEFISVGECLV